MSGFEDLFWDEPRRRLRSTTVEEMDEELRRQAADPFRLFEELSSSNPIEDYAVAHSDEIEPDSRRWLGKLFKRHKERLRS
jgi:hypothetical protein